MKAEHLDKHRSSVSSAEQEISASTFSSDSTTSSSFTFMIYNKKLLRSPSICVHSHPRLSGRPESGRGVYRPTAERVCSVAPLHSKSSNSQQVARLLARFPHPGRDEVRKLTYPSGENVTSRCERGSSFTRSAGNKTRARLHVQGLSQEESEIVTFLFSPQNLQQVCYFTPLFISK